MRFPARRWPPILLFIPSPFFLHGGFSLERRKEDYRAYSSIETVFIYCVIRNPLRLYQKSRLVYVAACLAATNDMAKDETVVDEAAKGLLRLMPRWYTSTPNNNNNIYSQQEHWIKSFFETEFIIK